MMQMQHGFTLLEVLLSVAIIGLLTGMSLPVYQSFQSRNDLDVTTESVAGMLRRAQTYARGMNGDGKWGVHVQTDGVTLFKGDTYLGRDPNYDETTTLVSNIVPSGTTDVLFAKMTATPTPTSATITLTQTNTNDAKAITINAKGTVAY